jgi:hypothetical protein
LEVNKKADDLVKYRQPFILLIHQILLYLLRQNLYGFFAF